MKHHSYPLFILILLSCSKQKQEPEPVKPNNPPSAFEVTSELGENGTDVVLSWTEAIDQDGDAVTYSVVHKDTLTKDLTSRTFTIKNLHYETTISGMIVADDKKGGKSEKAFSINTGIEPWDERFVKIPDEEFERLLVFQKIDNVIDGKFLKEKAKGVTTLILDNSNTLKSVSGIEIFEDLTGLSISSSNLEDEVIDISKNTKMWNLKINQAPKLKKIDVTNFSNLTYLIIKNTSLEEIDISKNKKLFTLYCLDSKIKTLDIKENTSINTIWIYGNQITSLDVSSSKTLKSLSTGNNPLAVVKLNSTLESLNISNTSLDIPRLSYPSSLLSLDLSRNKIQEIDLTRLPMLKSLYLNENKIKKIDFSDMLSLNDIELQFNDLEEINVSKNKLRKLMVNNNKLKSLDVRSSIFLDYFICKDNQISIICIPQNVSPGYFWEKDPTAIYQVCN